MVTKERILIKIDTIQNLSSVFKKRMFLKKGDSGWAIFGSILNLVLWNMLSHVVDGPLDKAMDMDYENAVMCRITELIFLMMLHDLGDVVKPGWLYPMNKVYGINWKANVNTAWGIVKACNGKYDRFGALVKVVDAHLAMLEHMNEDENDWLDAECIFCLELLTSDLIGITLCSHMFHHLCW